MTDVVRQLKIKSGSVGRLKKELGLYQEEEAKEQQKVSSLKAEGADEHDIKHAENVLAEAKMMIPDTRQRLSAALQDLSNLVGQAESPIKETEEYTAAAELMREAQSVLS